MRDAFPRIARVVITSMRDAYPFPRVITHIFAPREVHSGLNNGLNRPFWPYHYY